MRTSFRFVITWLIVAAIFVTGGAVLAGIDSIDESIDFFGGLGSVWDLFGGIGSFGTLIVAFIIAGAVIKGLLYMANKDYAGKKGLRWLHALLGLGVVIVAAGASLRWINLPSGLGWATVLFLGVITLATVALMVTWRTKPALAPGKTFTD